MQDGVGSGLGRSAAELMADWRVSRLPQVYHNLVLVPNCAYLNDVKIGFYFQHYACLFGEMSVEIFLWIEIKHVQTKLVSSLAVEAGRFWDATPG